MHCEGKVSGFIDRLIMFARRIAITGATSLGNFAETSSILEALAASNLSKILSTEVNSTLYKPNPTTHFESADNTLLWF